MTSLGCEHAPQRKYCFVPKVCLFVGCVCGCAVSGRFLFSQTKLEIFMIRSTVMVITSVIMGILSFPFRMWNLRKKWVRMGLERSWLEHLTGPEPWTVVWKGNTKPSHLGKYFEYFSLIRRVAKSGMMDSEPVWRDVYGDSPISHFRWYPKCLKMTHLIGYHPFHGSSGVKCGCND